MTLRPLTRHESFELALLACQVKVQVDDALGEALLKVAWGDDTALAEVHDRCNVLGDFAGADRVRRLIQGD